MRSRKEIADNLEEWANEWYEHTFNDKSARSHGEIKELRKIIKELRKIK